MNILLLIGVWLVSYVVMQFTGAIVARESNSFASFIFATGITLIVLGLL